MIEQRAFEFVEAVREVHTVEALQSLLLKYTSDVGVELIICGTVYGRNGVFSPGPMFGGFTHDWCIYYEKFHLFFDDAAAARLKVSRAPFTWSQVISDGGLTKSESHVLNEPRNFGLVEGLSVPLHGPLGELVGISFSGRYFKSTPVIECALHLMGRTAANRYFEIVGEDQLNVEAPPLTKRQRECLMWIERGKNNEDIADILEISPNTVKVHVEGAKKAFHVSTRLEAVVAARRFHLLGP